MSYSDFKDQVLQAVPIEVYIGRYVSLKKAGNTLKGLCPFHSEKTPSFTVNPEKGFYHCFGCGRGGDLFRFVMEYEKVPFPEALELLGRFAGLERPSSKKQQNDPLQKLFELNQTAMQHFTGFLRSADGRPYLEYLQKREIDTDTIRDFQLGAAPEEWDWLLKKFPESSWNDLIRLGLLKQGKENRKPYDFFRGRVVFPILDLRDRVIAFGGRVLPGSDNPAKYMNSPDSPLFHKSRVLYGLHRAAAEIRGKGRAILVEGYVDVIGLARAGWGNAVAPLGTALTSDHLQLLGRYTSSIVCLFDGDVAGRNAALRFARLVIENPQSGNLNANIVLLPPGLDPFDLARNLKFQENRVGEHLELSVTVARYFLYETMFPGNFAAHLTGRSPSPGDDSRTLLRLAVDYYSGKTPDWYPRGMEKRPALERLLETLGALQAGPNQHFLLEEAARILGLNPTELEREFSSR
ncbi:MAG: DNA primase, partial [Leptospiraceae bacterium]|nr:DNA primase [Leptospiraceae bacterium]